MIEKNVEVFLVRNENDGCTEKVTRSMSKALEYISGKSKDFTIERIFLDIPKRTKNDSPKFKEIKTPTEVKELESTYNDSDTLQSAIDNHVIKIYNKFEGNKVRMSKALDVTYKTNLKYVKRIIEKLGN